METSNVIRDGMTRRGFIAASENQYEALAFEFRPMLPEEVEEIESNVSALQAAKEAKKAVHLVAAIVTEKLISWSEIDEAKKPLTISFENVRRLPYPLLNRLYRIIARLSPSDPNPDWEKETQARFAEELIDRAKGKKIVDKDKEQSKN